MSKSKEIKELILAAKEAAVMLNEIANAAGIGRKRFDTPILSKLVKAIKNAEK